MNLQENIHRIKEVMGLNETNIPISIRRRAREEEIERYIKDSEFDLRFYCDHYAGYDYNESAYVNDVIVSAVANFLIQIDNDIQDKDYYDEAFDYLVELCKTSFSKYLSDAYETHCVKGKNSSLKEEQKKSEVSEKKESGEKWIKCVNCKKKFTQTIYKGKKSLPICPHCGTNNDLVIESEIPVYLKRRLFEWLPKFIRDTYESLAPWSFNSFDEYMERIIFNVVREISNSSGEENYEEIMKMREKLEPVISKYIVDNFSDEIEEYYSDNMTPG
jgi:DNA-directed RNA polymerase subunit RPC12/RpoP